MSHRLTHSPACALARALMLAAALGARAEPVAGATPLAADALPTDALLGRLVDEALTVRPELAQARASARGDRERVSQVAALPDPVLQLGVQNDSFTTWNVGKMETSFWQIGLSQTFSWPGTRGLRGEVASLTADRADLAIARLRLSTEAEVRRAYWRLLLARDRLALVARLEDLSGRAASMARTRYETGEGAQSDVLRAQLELNRLKTRRWGLQVEETSALETLNQLRARPSGEPVDSTTHLPDVPLPALPDPAIAVSRAVEQSPEVAAARVDARAGERTIELARRGWFPDVTVSLAVMPRGGSFPPMWSAGLGIPLPVFGASKQGRAVDEARARAAASRSATEAMKQLVRLRASERRAALAAALETVALYRGGLLVQSRATAESTLAQYQVGRVPFTAVLEANAGLVADQEGHLTAIAQAQLLATDDAEDSPGASPGGLSPSSVSSPAAPPAPSGM